MRGKTSYNYQKNAVAIYKWIEENKWKYPKGITASTLFSGVVLRPSTNYTEYYPADLQADSPLWTNYTQLIIRMRQAGYLRYEKPTPDAPCQWRVVEEMLPPGTATYTGVKQPIPTDSTYTKNPPVVLEPSDELTKEAKKNIMTAARAFYEEELKSIPVEFCRLWKKRSGGFCANISLGDATAYDVYKLGLTLRDLAPKEDDEKAQTEDNPVDDTTKEETLDSTDTTEEEVAEPDDKSDDHESDDHESESAAW